MAVDWAGSLVGAFSLVVPRLTGMKTNSSLLWGTARSCSCWWLTGALIGGSFRSRMCGEIVWLCVGDDDGSIAGVIRRS